MDAFDADVLIYAATPGHPLGLRVAALFTGLEDDGLAGVGSVLLLPEVLSKPLRIGDQRQVSALTALLSRLDLVALDREGAELATSFGSRYRLRAADAVHLATAVDAGADRLITNNRRDFTSAITEVEVVHPDSLPG